MYEFIATGVGRKESRVGNVLRDLGAAFASLLWLVVDFGLNCRSAMISSTDDGLEPLEKRVRDVIVRIDAAEQLGESEEKEAA